MQTNILSVSRLTWSLRLSLVLAACLFAIECKGAEVGRSLIELPVKPDIPTLILPDNHGEVFNISKMNSPVVVVNFWATWCTACVSEMLSMNQAAKQFKKQGVEVITINVGDSQYKINNFFREYEPTYKVLIDHQAKTTSAWQIQGLPTTYVISPDRKIHYGAIGLLAWESDVVQQQILGLLR